MKKSLLAIAVLLSASITAHAQQIKEETIAMADESDANAIANSSTAKCQIILGSEDAANTYKSDDRYSDLPRCKRNLDLQEEKVKSAALISKGSVIL